MIFDAMKTVSMLPAVLLLAGCGLYYQPPADISPQTTATIVGSHTMLQDGDEVRVVGSYIDGAARFAAPFRWDTPFPIKAGSHDLTVGVFRFSGGLAVAYGMDELPVTITPGTNYSLQLQNASPPGGSDNVLSASSRVWNVWLADANGNQVGNKTLVFFQPPTTVLLLP